MSSDYFGIRILLIPLGDRWQWQVTLPIGVIITSPQTWESAEQALEQGRLWISAETAFQALNHCLSEFSTKGAIHQREYCDLLQSLVQLTRHAH